jgi:hypothetical protein
MKPMIAPIVIVIGASSWPLPSLVGLLFGIEPDLNQAADCLRQTRRRKRLLCPPFVDPFSPCGRHPHVEAFDLIRELFDHLRAALHPRNPFFSRCRRIVPPAVQYVQWRMEGHKPMPAPRTIIRVALSDQQLAELLHLTVDAMRRGGYDLDLVDAARWLVEHKIDLDDRKAVRRTHIAGNDEPPHFLDAVIAVAKAITLDQALDTTSRASHYS